jgi:S1-C subfamily serine protease
MRSTAILSSAVLMLAAASAGADGAKKSAFDRYGIGGYIQPVGLHHGFHVEVVVPGSDAARDQLNPHDIIVRVDGDAIRSLDHLRAVLAEAYLNESDVSITYTRGASLTHHVVKSQFRPEKPKPVARKRAPDDDERR